MKELPKMKGNNWVAIADFEFFMKKKIFLYKNLHSTDWWNKWLVPEQIVSVYHVPLQGMMLLTGPCGAHCVVWQNRIQLWGGA
jgi:hypothetical protein